MLWAANNFNAEGTVAIFFDFDCVDLPAGMARTVCQKIADDPTSIVISLVITAIATLAVTLVRPIRDWLWSLAKNSFNRVFQVWDAGGRLRRASDSVALSGPGPWLTIKRDEPRDYARRMALGAAAAPVIVCANLKGGVGKTTTIANLAAAFAARKSNPVLIVDLDYQGSLSSLMFAGQSWRPTTPGERSSATLAIGGRQEPDFFATVCRPVTWIRDPDATPLQVLQARNLEGIAAFDELAEEEDRMRLLWAIAEERRDLRYFLYELLHDDAIRARFSMVFIDAPPRLTTACVQALAASNYLLIPTILDEMSSIGVGYFGRQLRRHDEIWPHLKVLGVFGSMAGGERHEQGALRSAGDALRKSLEKSRKSLYAVEASGVDFEFPYQLSIPQWAAFGRTTRRGISYCALGQNDEGRNLRKVYDALADEIEKRMKL